MYTRCPDCHTVHPVSAALLTRGSGRFRCGKCNKVSNALDALFDEWPEPGEQPASPGELPVLGVTIDLDSAAQSRLIPEESGQYAEDQEGPKEKGLSGNRLLRAGLIVATLAIALFVVIKLADFHEQPVFGKADLDTAIERLGLKDAPPAEPFRDLEQIHLVSRELRSHPTEDGRLLLSATIVNRARMAQAYPELEVILFDETGSSLASHRFQPDDYLAEGVPPDTGMTPQAYLPLTLDLEDPGLRAVGFELQFH